MHKLGQAPDQRRCPDKFSAVPAVCVLGYRGYGPMLTWFKQWRRNRDLRQYYKRRYSEWFDLDADYFSETPDPGAGSMPKFEVTTSVSGLGVLERPVSTGSPLR